MQHQGTLNYSEGQSGKPPYLHQDKLTAWYLGMITDKNSELAVNPNRQHLGLSSCKPPFTYSGLSISVGLTGPPEIVLQTQPWAQLIDGDIT